MIVNLIILLGMMAYIGRGDDAARHRRLHPDDGHGRRLERADLRAHQGGARREQRGARAAIAASFDRVFWTLLDTHVTSLIAAAFLFQFGTGPIRGFATTLVRRADQQPLHVDFRVADAVRVHPVAPAGQRASRQHLGDHADSSISEFRLRQVALARDRAVAARHPRRRRDDLDARPAARRRLRRRQHRHRQVPAGHADRAGPRRRSRAMPNGVGNDAVVQEYGEPAAAHGPGAGRRRPRRRAGQNLSRGRRRGRGGAAAGEHRHVRSRRHGNRRSGRRPAAEAAGHAGDGVCARRHPGLHRAAVPGQLRRRRDRRDAPRPARLRWRSWPSSATT